MAVGLREYALRCCAHRLQAPRLCASSSPALRASRLSSRPLLAGLLGLDAPWTGVELIVSLLLLNRNDVTPAIGARLFAYAWTARPRPSTTSRRESGLGISPRTPRPPRFGMPALVTTTGCTPARDPVGNTTRNSAQELLTKMAHDQCCSHQRS